MINDPLFWAGFGIAVFFAYFGYCVGFRAGRKEEREVNDFRRAMKEAEDLHRRIRAEREGKPAPRFMRRGIDIRF